MGGIGGDLDVCIYRLGDLTTINYINMLHYVILCHMHAEEKRGVN